MYNYYLVHEYCTAFHFRGEKHRAVSPTFEIVQILVHSHFDLVSSVLAPVSQPVTEMALELINNRLISVEQKR